MADLFGDTTGLPQTTASGIPYEIQTLNYTEQWIPGANQTTINCRVAWADSSLWVQDMVGRVRRVNGPSGYRLDRTIPEQNPFFPAQWCTKVEQISQGGNIGSDPASGWPQTQWCMYRATFESLQYQILPNSPVWANPDGELTRYVARSRKAIAKELGVPLGQFRTVSSNPDNRKAIQQGAFIALSYSDIQMTWVRLPIDAIPLTRIQSLLGKINEYQFDTLGDGYNFPAGTLLFAGYSDTNRYWDANGDYVVDLVYYFRENPNGWNYFLDAKCDFVEVSLNGETSGRRPYLKDDFTWLFVPKQ